MKLRSSIFAALCVAAAATAAAEPPGGSAADPAAVYYVSVGDSLAASIQPTGDRRHGYVEQLYAALRATRPNLRLVKLGCGGESTVSMRYGTQDPTRVLGCAPPPGQSVIHPSETQLRKAMDFLNAHRGQVAVVTIDIGGNDLLHIDAHGKPVYCPLDPTGCGTRIATMARNLAAVLRELKAAAGPGVPFVGMTYDDVVAPRCISNRSLMSACERFDVFNRTLADTYAAAHVPVADVAGAFENGDLGKAAKHVCAWTWFCSRGDMHPNTVGYGVIALAFQQILPSATKAAHSP